MPRSPFLAPCALLTAVAAAAALGACSSHGSAGVIPAALSGASGDVRSKPTPKPTATPGKLLFVPHALNFTTVPTLVMRLKEPKYKGKFHFLVTPRHFVKIAPATVKGPNAKITVTSTATNPGTGTITILDDHGGKKNVPVTVTSGVIVIQ